MSRPSSARERKQTSISQHLTSANAASKAAKDTSCVQAGRKKSPSKMPTSPSLGEAGVQTPSAGLTMAMFSAELSDQMAKLSAQISAQVAGQFETWRSEMAKQRSEMFEGVDAALKTALAPIYETLRGVNDRLGKQASTTAEMEAALSDHETRLAEMEREIGDLRSGARATKEANAKLELAVEDLICRNKRQNLRLVNIPEQAEGSNPAVFVKTMLMDLLGEDPEVRSPDLILDRAHRSLGPRREGGPPRAFIVRFHEYSHKELVLKWAKKKGNIDYRGFRFRIYEDYAPSLAKKRAVFNRVKAMLHKDKEVTFGMLYPARLRITMTRGGTTHYFDSAEAAEDFYLRNKTG